MFCPKCGAELADDSQYCTECGARVARAGASRHDDEASGGTAGSRSSRLHDSISRAGRTTWVRAVASSRRDDEKAGEENAPEPSEPTRTSAAQTAGGTSEAVTSSAGTYSAHSDGGYSEAGVATSPDVTLQQPVVRSFDEEERLPRHALPPAAIAAICAAVVVVIVAAVWFALSASSRSSASSEPSASEQQTTESVPLDISATSINTASYPQVVVDLSLTAAGEDADISAITAGDLTLVESTDAAGDSDVSIDRFSVSADDGTCRIVYTSGLPQDDSTRSLRIDFDELSGFVGGTSVRFTIDVPQDTDEDDSEEPAADDDTSDEGSTDVAGQDGFVLADSDTRRYTSDDLEDLSDWELEVARNEIYARHGREFSNKALQDYFNSQSWYEPRYSAEEFDALDGVLNQTEVANAELILSVEQERASDGQ